VTPPQTCAYVIFQARFGTLLLVVHVLQTLLAVVHVLGVKLSLYHSLSRRPRAHAAMTILPVSAPSTPRAGSFSPGSSLPFSSGSRIPAIFRRLHRFQQMVHTRMKEGTELSLMICVSRILNLRLGNSHTFASRRNECMFACYELTGYFDICCFTDTATSISTNVCAHTTC
jgi:hypothetical protein